MATEAMLQRLCRDKYALTRLYHSASIINILPQQEYENNNCKMDFFLWENTEWNIITKNQKSKSEKGEPKKKHASHLPSQQSHSSKALLPLAQTLM
jgi:hypothetical protein